MTPTSSPMPTQREKPLPQPPSAQRAISRNMQTVQEARTKVAELTTEVEQLRETHKEVQGRTERLAVEVAQLKSAHEKDEARINDLTNEGVRLRLKYEDLKEQLKAVLPPHMTNLMAEMKEVSDKNEVLSAQNSDLQREVVKLKAEVEKLEKDRENNWTAFRAAGVELPQSSSDDEHGDSGGCPGDTKSPNVKQVEVKRSCEGGVM